LRRTIIRKHFRRVDGQALILVILAMPLFFAVCGVVIDGTNLMVNKRQMQNSADAAALAAAQTLDPAIRDMDLCLVSDSGCRVAVQNNPVYVSNAPPFTNSVAYTAQEYVDKNWPEDPPTLTRCSSAEETNCWSWPYQKDMYGVDPGYSNDAYHFVQVKLKRPVNGFFTRVVGFLLRDDDSNPPFDVGARAVAAANPELGEQVNTTPGTTNPGTIVDPQTNYGTTTLYSTSTSTTTTGGAGAVAFTMSEDCAGAAASPTGPAGASIQWSGAESSIKGLATNGGISVSGGTTSKTSEHIQLGKKGQPGCEDFYGALPNPTYFPDVRLLDPHPIPWPVPPPSPAPPAGCTSPTTPGSQNQDFTITAVWLATHPPGTYCLNGLNAKLSISATNTTFNGYTFFAPRIAVSANGSTFIGAPPSPGQPQTVFDAYGTDYLTNGRNPVSACGSNVANCAFSMSGQSNSITGNIFAPFGTISLSGGSGTTGLGGSGFLESQKLLISGNFANFIGTGPLVGATTTTTTTTTSTVLTTETVIPGYTLPGTTVDGSTVTQTITTGRTFALDE
jgi:hypothetical protein